MTTKPRAEDTQLASVQLPLSPLAQALESALGPDGVAALDPRVPPDVWRAALVGPAAAFLDRPGKDLRARLVRAGFVLGGGAAATCPAALTTTIELLHAGSLIVDDVQDASTVRRGAPALHCLIGAPLAINTGSWMYFWALAELAKLGLPDGVQRAVATLVRCHQGQALDLATRITEIDARDVPAVVAATTRLKTGALCRLATELGALAAGASPAHVDAIGALGEATGIALQMLDDLGCLVAPARHVKAWEDLRALRPTWPWAWLAELGDKFTWARLTGLARHLHDAPDEAGAVTVLAAAIVEKVEHTGRTRVRAQLAAGLAALTAAMGGSPAIDAVAADLAAMEAMYG